ncbi:hypothetical protein ACEUCJ_15060 [Aeromonas rivipollensis]|uniref:hypothetical protein n=1 Tax=Aeromonas rivipollensis TaxID=948519 RepID=UPI0038CFBB7F
MAAKTQHETSPTKPARKRKAAAPASEAAPLAPQVEQAAAPAPEAEAAPLDPQIVLRRSIAGNYLTHCHHARVAECQAMGGDPAEVGLTDAMMDMAIAALDDLEPADMIRHTRAMAAGLGAVGIGGQPLPLWLMRHWIADLAAQGAANSVLGTLQDVVAKVAREHVDHQIQLVMQSVAPLIEPAPAPTPAPEVAA